MKKRFLPLVLAVAMLLVLLPTAALAADSDFTISNGTLQTYNGPGDVVIPDGDTYIGYKYEFYGCTALTSINIPDSVTSIGESAFKGCTSLTSVTIPDSVTSIERYAFKNCSALTNVTIGSGVTSIDMSAFQGCTALTSITIRDGVTSIGMGAFQGCTSLTSVTIPDSVISIRYSAFKGCTGLTSVMIGNGVTDMKGNAFSGCAALTSVTIPDSVTRIGWDMFKDCTNLTGVTIPNSVTSIGDSAFEGCAALTSVTIPTSVTSIGRSAFSGCAALTNITVAEGNPSYTSQDGIVFNESKTALICYPAGKADSCYTIPDSVTRIVSNAFSGCAALTNIAVAESNQNYVSQDGIVFNKSKTALICYPAGKADVYYTVPDSVTEIGSCAFYACTGLTSVMIPDSVTRIGENAFNGCHGMDVYYGGTQEQWEATWRNITASNTDISLDSSNTVHYNSAMPAAPTTAYASTQTVDVDGKAVTFQCYALKDANGNMTNYIKLRDLAALLNGSAAQFQVGWDGSVTITTQTAYTPNGSELSTPYSGDRAYQETSAATKVNGQSVNLAAFVLNDDQGGGYTYYQLRDLGQALGFNVGWAADKGIFLETGIPYNAAN